MRTPSIKTLREVFGDNAVKAKYLLTCDTRVIIGKAAYELRRQSLNPVPKYLIRLSALNELAGLHGIESCESVNDEYAEYINTGDMYAATVIYWRGRYRVQSMGDFVETIERNNVAKFK